MGNAHSLSKTEGQVNIRPLYLTTGGVNLGNYTLTLGGSANTVVDSIVSGSGGLTKDGAGTVLLTNSNSFTGTTLLSSGTLQLGSPTALGSGSITVASGATLDINGQSWALSKTLTNSGIISGTLTVNSGASAILNGASTTGAITASGTVTIAGSTNLAIGTINGSGTAGIITQNNTYSTGSGVVLNFANGSSFATISGAANTKTTLTNGGGTTYFTSFFRTLIPSIAVNLDGGTWNISALGQNSSNFQFDGTLNIMDGAVLNQTNARYSGHGTYNVGGTGGGTFNLGSGWSVENPAVNATFAYNALSSGTITSAGGMTLSTSGANTVATTTGMSVANGGAVSITGSLTIGGTVAQGTGGSETNTLTVSAGGKLLDNGTFSFNPTLTSVTNTFNWAGQLSAATIITANLPSATLANNGGILAPGDIGTAGKTTITGSYVQGAGGNLVVDIGGTTQGSAFQTGQYDFVSVSSNTALDGRLSFGLINSYTPVNNTTTLYKILTGLTPASSLVGGSFSNQVTAISGNSRVVGADGLSSFLIAINNTGATATTGGLTSVPARTVALGGYQPTNSYSGAGTAWDTTNAGAWTNFDAGATATPASQASGAIAQFADGPASTGAIGVSLNSTRNIQGIQFASTAGSRAYTISQGGSGALILDNTGNSASATIADTSTSGTANAINVPITLNSNLSVSVANAANTLTLGGAIGDADTGKTLTKTGTGTLALTAVNTYTGTTTVKAGTLYVSGSLSSSSAVTVGDSGNLATVATLAGSGSMGNVTVGAAALNTGAELCPSNNAGTSRGNNLSVGSLTILSGAHLDLQIGRTSAFSVGGGNGTLGGDVSDNVTASGLITLTSADLKLSLLPSTGYSLAQNDVIFLLINGLGTAVNGTFTSLNGSATNLGEGQVFALGSQLFEITYHGSYSSNSFTGGQDISLMMVPEPSTWTLLTGGLGLLMLARRSRKA